jgi:hypothetical protein
VVAGFRKKDYKYNENIKEQGHSINKKISREMAAAFGSNA